MNVKGKDLDIVDKDKYEYIMTYSYPCQDLSLAGTRKGMERGSNTRSSLLWEVERILQELHHDDALPQILLMENVPQVISQANIESFRLFEAELRDLGYTNYCEIINAKDYIPQNRARCFMISILGNYLYKFPKRTPTTKKLKDMLETNVDEKILHIKEDD